MLENAAAFGVKPRPQKGVTSEADRARSAAYRARDPEKYRERTREWRARNRDYLRAYKKGKYEANKDRYAERSAAAHALDPRRRLLNRARARAKKFGVKFEITLVDVVVPELCPVTQVKLQFTRGRVTAASPSLDRVDNRLGYVRGNVRVISYKANTYKGDMTPEEIERLARYVRGEL
jgi:hypothetical protein